MKLETINIFPNEKHTHSVIWMHGLGADGHDFEAIVPELKLANQNHIHFIFPNAPVQAVTINGGMKMRSWYDILEMSLERKVDINGIYDSSVHINSIIEEEIEKGIPSENILLAGFSQGGVIALHAGLRFPKKLAGILALSTYLPTTDSLQKEKSDANLSTEILMCHGSVDPVVSIDNAKQAYDSLKSMNYPIKWNEYYMQHSVCPEEIGDISIFITKILI